MAPGSFLENGGSSDMDFHFPFFFSREYINEPKKPFRGAPHFRGVSPPCFTVFGCRPSLLFPSWPSEGGGEICNRRINPVIIRIVQLRSKHKTSRPFGPIIKISAMAGARTPPFFGREVNGCPTTFSSRPERSINGAPNKLPVGCLRPTQTGFSVDGDKARLPSPTG